VIVIHPALLAAVQLHPEGAVTLALPLPPAAGKFCDDGLIEYEQPPTPDCVTVKVRPATVIVPVRAAPVFAATEKFTAPLPDPLAPEVMVIQESLLRAVQLHPEAAVTETLPTPPLIEKGRLAGLIEKEQAAPD
jgi:hypothetical protein